MPPSLPRWSSQVANVTTSVAAITHAPAPGNRSARAAVVVAVDDDFTRAWVRYALRAARMPAHVVADRAALFDALADAPRALVLAGIHDGVPAAALLATIRTTGCDVPVVVLSPVTRPRLGAAPALALAAVLREPLDSRALIAALARRTGRWRRTRRAP
ncbi:MAG: hypothetical protein H6708_29285 [Kofleriaceae bacterium]|nr:hypothetical protein [Kofleriaceae bacterium]